MPTLDKKPTKVSKLPPKLKRQLFISFCLSSILPTLIWVFVISSSGHFVTDGKTGQWGPLVLMGVFSLVFSMVGYLTTKQMVQPIVTVAESVRRIASGNLELDLESQNKEELDDLSNNLRSITHNVYGLLERVEKLSMIDKVTDLYNESYIRKQLEDEVQRCIYYQRPCAMALITIDILDIYSSTTKTFTDEKKLKAAADIIKNNIGELDRAARLESGEFVVIFPDKNKKKAIEDASNIRTLMLTKVFASEQTTASIVDVFVGIAENPLDGNSARDLFEKSRTRAEWAREKVSGVEAFS